MNVGILWVDIISVDILEFDEKTKHHHLEIEASILKREFITDEIAV
jgi:hypothetical protein